MIPESTSLAWLKERFTATAGDAKYERLYLAVLMGIREGVLSPGVKLPPEQALAANLSVSLATVRRCYSRLAQSGVISREHGRGTFVSKEEHGASDLWHFRFRDPGTGGFMGIYNRILWRGYKSVPQVADSLGADPTRLVYIERAVNIGTCFVCYSQLYLPGEKFERILDEPLSELERVNIKDVLTFEFHSPTLRTVQLFRVDRVSERAADVMEMAAGAPALLLTATGYTFGERPISHQKIWIPETAYDLEMPATAEIMHDLFGRRGPSLRIVGNE